MSDLIRNTLTSSLNDLFVDRCEFLTDQNYSVVVNHFGEFSQDLINSLSVGIEGLVTSSGDSKQITKRIFSILIEGLQNARIHSSIADDEKKSGFLLLGRTDDSYSIVIGNITSESELTILEDHIHRVNSLEEKGLKQRYLKILTEGNLSEKGGAGLGIITMRMKSDEPLSFTAIPDGNGHVLFAINCVIRRK